MKQIILWGTGKIATEVLHNCGNLDQYEIVGVIDNNSQKWDTIFEGYKVYSPDILYSLDGITVVVLTDAYKEVTNQIMLKYKDCRIYVEHKYYFFKERILNRYKDSKDLDIKNIVSYIKEHDLKVFNYSFVNKYTNMNDVQLDEENGLYYVMHKKKRMYFSRSFITKEQVNDYYNSILLEQDMESPHRYFQAGFGVEIGDVVIDVGVAEGNFSLEIIDKVSKLYLIESDPGWIEALQLTFMDYRDKVTLIQGFASSYCDGSYITLDSIINDKVDCIKMDIEGNEWDALQGSERIINESKKIRLAICSYHGDFDQELIEYFMDKRGIKHWTSDGYMWFPYKIRQTYVSSKLNKGIVFGLKQ